MESKYMASAEIRKIFLDFFASKGHCVVKSSSLLPQSDPTLLFTNAGMVPFKDVFLGRVKKGYVCAASSQKCMRAGGKHNDLEVVGKTNRHHTFFEMLGNFSFGDYFKEGAIELCWEFLTKTLSISPQKLWITVYKDDDEAFKLWHEKIGIPDDKILRLGEKDNFWSMGDTGPCGPCSEIFFDGGEENGCGSPDCGVECECGRFKEIWNLVFMQYERDSKGDLKPLPKPSIDTGMGLERLATVMQGVKSNFDTDLFTPIMNKIEELTSLKYVGESDDAKDISFRVIADHARAATFLISDGVLPSNEGRGYVLRRIIRRAARHGKNIGLKDPFLYQVSGTVIDLMQNGYPELTENADLVSLNIRNEEERFGATLEFGLNVFEEILSEVAAAESKEISGEKLFKLYDTFGFPLDIAQDIAEERGFTIDLDGYNQAMNEQKQRARASWKGDEGSVVNDTYSKLLPGYSATNFLGYESQNSEGEVLAILNKSEMATEAKEGDEIVMILDRSVFYAESGGQMGDRGTVWSQDGKFEVTETKKITNDIFIHNGKVISGALKKGDHVRMSVDPMRREDTERNHSATHLLHSALREVLGDHVKQAGSSVSSDRLRFDFTHFAAPTKEELHKVENRVNEIVRENLSVDTTVASFDEAVQSGAMALFGEKYGDKVRVVKVGNFSTELCGGTHTSATGRIGLFKIVHEGGIAAGVRRVDALTGRASYEFIHSSEKRLSQIRELLRSAPAEEAVKLKRLLEKNRELEKELDKAREKIVAGGTDSPEDIRKVGETSVIAKKMENVDVKNLRLFVDSAKVKIKSGIVVAGCVIDGKVSLVAGVTKDLTKKFNAGKIVGQVAKIVNGKGGGRADMAQAGGADVSKIDEALDKVCEIVERFANG